MNIGLTSFGKGGIVARIDGYYPAGLVEDGKTGKPDLIYRGDAENAEKSN